MAWPTPPFQQDEVVLITGRSLHTEKKQYIEDNRLHLHLGVIAMVFVP